MKQRADKVNQNKDSLFSVFSPSALANFKAALGLLLILFLFRLKGFLNLDEYYFGSVQGDAGLYLWLIKTNLRDIFHFGWFEKAAFYPYSNVLAWSDSFLLPSLVAWPLFKLGLSDQIVFNFLLLAAGFLNGYCTYRLAARLSGEIFAAFLGGAAFMTLPYFTYQLGHPQLQFFFFIPLGIEKLIDFINQKNLASGVKLAVVVAAAFLTTVYYAIFLAITSLSMLAAILLLRPGALKRRDFFTLIMAGVIALLPLTPFLLPYLSVQETFGKRHLYEAFHFAAKYSSYLSSVPKNILYGVTSGFSHSEAHLFPGLAITILAALMVLRVSEAAKLKVILTIALGCFAAAGIVIEFLPTRYGTLVAAGFLWMLLFFSVVLLFVLGKLERRLECFSITGRSLAAIFLFTAIIFFLISLGPVGNPERGQLPYAPFSAFYYLVPGLSSIRAVGRSGIMVLFCLNLLAVLYLSRLLAKESLRNTAIIAFLFIMIENIVPEYPLTKIPPIPGNVESLSEESAAVFLPYSGALDKNGLVKSWSEYAKINMTYLLWAQDHKTPLLNGYSGFKNKFMRDYPRELRDFPTARAIDTLSRVAGIRQIIFASEFARDFNAEEFERRIAGFSSALKLISKDSRGSYLFELDGEVRSTAERPILVPAKNGLKLKMEVRTAFKTEGDKEEVRLLRYSDDALLAAAEIAGDGRWSAITFEIPKQGENVRPLLLKLEGGSGSQIIARRLAVSE